MRVLVATSCIGIMSEERRKTHQIRRPDAWCSRAKGRLTRRGHKVDRLTVLCPYCRLGFGGSALFSMIFGGKTEMKIKLLLPLVGFVVATTAVSAHHSFAAEFDEKAP